MTDTQLHAMLMHELGITSEADKSMLEKYWSLYSDESNERVRYLRVQLHVLRRLMTQARTSIDVTVGTDKLEASQLFKHLRFMWDQAIEELKLEAPNGIVPTLTVVSPTYIPEE